MRNIPIVAIALAGLMHLAIIPEHYAHAPAHGIFFALAGIVEIAWAVMFWRRPTLALYHVGLALAGGLVVLWAITRVLPAPFGHGPEAINPSGLVCKVSELMGVVTLAMLAFQGRLIAGMRLTARRAAGEAVALALTIGVASFGISHAAAPLLPALGHQEEHVHATEAPHAEHVHATEAPHAEHVHATEAPGPTEQVHHEEHAHAANTPGAAIMRGKMHIEGVWARPAVANGNGAVYLTLVNEGQAHDHLLGARTDVATTVELHQTKMEGGVMKMQPVAGGIEVPGGGRVELKPGGYHIMLIGLKRDLKPGEHFPIVLRFEEGREITVDAEIRQP